MNKEKNNSIFPIDKIFKILDTEFKNWDVPVISLIAITNKEPFKVLIATIISLRTKDEITIDASKKIFEILKNPQDIDKITIKNIEELIYPCGFYRRKTIQIKNICEILNKEYNCIVPNNLEELLKLPGVGRKTANLVLAQGYQIPAICVDTHVHRISNRFGYLNTKTPDETEIVLRENLPKKYWIKYNTLLVGFGQKICRPISPHCTKCKVEKYCKKVGVLKFR